MPIYEYECQSCGHVLDALQKISDDPLKHCPDCGEPSLKKLLSAPRFRLKGSGWYETDFKDKNRRLTSTGHLQFSEHPQERLRLFDTSLIKIYSKTLM